jgi:hypothetical protein
MKLLDQPLGEQAAGHLVGGGDEAHEIVGRHTPVDHDHRNAALHRTRHNWIESIRLRGAHQQDVNAALKQVFDVRDLFRWIVVRVGDDQLLDDVLCLAAAASME